MSKSKPTDAITIRAFRAVEDNETSEAFVRGHHESLQQHGIEGLTSARPDWVDDPDVYVVVAQSSEGHLLGGVRIHKSSLGTPLPVEAAVGEVDPGVKDLVHREARKGTGEACGMWLSEQAEGTGLSTLLLRAAISIADQIGTRTLFGFCSDHTAALICSMGFQVIRSLGDQGDFLYPSPEFVSRVLIMNAVNVRDASTENYAAIRTLRESPVQQRMESSSQQSFAVSYQLALSAAPTLSRRRIYGHQESEDSSIRLAV